MTVLVAQCRATRNTEAATPPVVAPQQNTAEGVPKSEGYLNRSFPGVQKGWIEGGGEEWWQSEQGLKGKEEGQNEGKRVGGKGPESTLEKL